MEAIPNLLDHLYHFIVLAPLPEQHFQAIKPDEYLGFGIHCTKPTPKNFVSSTGQRAEKQPCTAVNKSGSAVHFKGHTF